MYKSVENVQFDDIMMTKADVHFIKFIEKKGIKPLSLFVFKT